MLTFEEVNILGQILNTTWGRCSTPRGDFPVGSAPQFSIKGNIFSVTNPDFDVDESAKNRMMINYTTVVTFRREHEAQAECARFAVEAEKLISDSVKSIKAEFKSSAGRTLNVKSVNKSDSLEIFHTGDNMSVYTQRYRPNIHRAFYRYSAVFDIK